MITETQINELVIQLPFTALDIKRMDMLGLSTDQMKDVATAGLRPQWSIHWHRLVVWCLKATQCPTMTEAIKMVGDRKDTSPTFGEVMDVLREHMAM